MWADETTKAAPFWDDDESVPSFVKDTITGVLEGAIFDSFESLPGFAADALTGLFRDNLLQPQGWSLRSISEDIEERFGIPGDDAELIARTESASILNNAREEGYEEIGISDEPVFEWIGPSDHRTTDACKWLKDQTEGGVTMDRLIELEQEATRKFFPHLDFRRHLVHPQCRHTFSETFKMSVEAGTPVTFKIDETRADPAAGMFRLVG